MLLGCLLGIGLLGINTLIVMPNVKNTEDILLLETKEICFNAALEEVFLILLAVFMN